MLFRIWPVNEVDCEHFITRSLAGVANELATFAKEVAYQFRAV